MTSLRERITTRLPGASKKTQEDDTAGAASPGRVTAGRRHVIVCADGTWAWYLLRPQPWTYLGLDARANLLARNTLRLTDLVGHQIKLRVSAQPFPFTEWAREHDRYDEHRRLPDVEGGPVWEDDHATVQEHIKQQRLQDPFAYIGVRISKKRLNRDALHRLFDREPAAASIHEARRSLQSVDEAVAKDGFQAIPLSKRRLTWLLHASQALGVPVDTVGLSDGPEQWNAADLDPVTGPVEVTADPLAAHAVVHAIRNGRRTKRYVSVLTVGPLPDVDTDDLGAVPWMAYTNGLNAHVEWCATFEVRAGESLRRSAEHTRKVAEDQYEHYLEHKENPPKRVDDSIKAALRVENEVNARDAALATRLTGQIRCAVISEKEDELPSQVTAVTTAVRQDLGMTLFHTQAQRELVLEFRPGQGIAPQGGHQRTAPAYYVATAMPHVATGLGDARGFYFGQLAVGGRSAVMIDTSDGPRQKKSGGAAAVAELGHGKSVLIFHECYESARAGRRTYAYDGSGQLAALCRMRELRKHSRHIELANADPGKLNPYRMVIDPPRAFYDDEQDFVSAVREADAERRGNVAEALLGFLPLTTAARAGTDQAIEDAVSEVGGLYGTNPWRVIEQLERQGEFSERIAKALHATMGLKGARLLFPETSADTDDSDDLVDDAVLTVITMRGLTMPTGPAKKRSERVAVVTLGMAAQLGARALYADKEPKTIWTDEGGILSQEGTGFPAFALRGYRDSRKSNARFGVGTQLPGDLLAIDPELPSLLSTVFAGRLEGESAAKSTLTLAGLDPESGRHTALQNMPRGHWLIRDTLGRHGIALHDITWRSPEWLAAVDTNPADAIAESYLEDHFAFGIGA